jgi:hypothetical protein
MYGEFEPDQNVWAPLGDPPRDSFDRENLATHSTRSLIRAGAEARAANDAAAMRAVHAELLRRFHERQQLKKQ